MVLVDSDVWSEAFRKQSEGLSPEVLALRDLIDTEQVLTIGPIRQEVLSGLSDTKKYENIRKILRSFPDEVISTDVFELAAKFFNHCRSNGIQGSHTDFLICACSVSWDVQILSKDNDYKHYAKLIPILLYDIKGQPIGGGDLE
jgi:predicted nucleic acid-binding protein